jgi:hypothetical protein
MIPATLVIFIVLADGRVVTEAQALPSIARCHEVAGVWHETARRIHARIHSYECRPVIWADRVPLTAG